MQPGFSRFSDSIRLQLFPPCGSATRSLKSCTACLRKDPGAHDLVDLQLIFRKGDVNLVERRSTCERLFAYRGQQSWPPVVEVGANWESLYAEAAEGLAVVQDVGDAVEWANRLIEEIAK